MASPSAVLASEAVVEFVPPFDIGTVPRLISPADDLDNGAVALTTTVPAAFGRSIFRVELEVTEDAP